MHSNSLDVAPSSCQALGMQTKSEEFLVQVLGGASVRLRRVPGESRQLELLEVIGCHRWQAAIQSWFEAQEANGVGLSLPMGEQRSVHDLLLAELQTKLRGEWQFPFAEFELCHCRGVPAAVVDRAVLLGSHTRADVSRTTSAGTSCGTCRPDIDAILDYRLHKTK